ncbi:MAG TPA: DUF1501 domain-containing protein [Armatimonadota bacterium]|nr:DUF1501 domain-containing protein [Armatimonadota bacterium]
MNPQSTRTKHIPHFGLRRCAVLAAVSLSIACSLAKAQDTNTPATTAPKPKAKAVIQIWLWGGPSQLDTFDPKPNAGSDYTGPLNKPIDTNVKGIQIGELLPQLAQQADKYAIIRSMTHGNNGHETAAYMMLTGHKPGDGVVYPSVGSLVSYFKGYGHGYTGLIPPNIMLTEGQGRFAEEGFLGPLYKSFATGGDPNQKQFMVDGVITPGISDQRQSNRQQLLHSLDALGKDIPDNQDFTALDKSEKNAYELILGDSRKVFDLTQEPDAIRDRYGRNKFGQSCLVARRLVESGVPYITINYGGWDTHKQHFEIMRRKLPELDQGLSALLQDLSDRHLLDTTIVWCCGEFGRTPKVDWDAPWNGGRGHFGNCFSVLVAGGGFKGGHVVGATDAKGEKVIERPVYPEDLIGSILELLGINPDDKLPNSRGLDLKVMPSSDNTPGHGRLHEIM